MYKPHPQLSGMILEKKLPKKQSDINKSINSNDQLPTTVVFIAKAHS